MKCETCGSPAVSIRIALGREETVTFFSCPTCDTKRWTNDEGVVPLDRVLEIASGTRLK